MQNLDEAFNSPAVIGHIEMLQGIIDRMASNSANCKTWSVTLVVAVFALSDTSGFQRFYICLGATLMFYLLDCFYLGMERRFIKMQRSFVAHIYGESLEIPKSTSVLGCMGIFKKKNQPETTTKQESNDQKPFKLAILPFVFVLVKPETEDNGANSNAFNATHMIIMSPNNCDIEPSSLSQIDIPSQKEMFQSKPPTQAQRTPRP